MSDFPYSKDMQIELLLAHKLFSEMEKLHPNEPEPWKNLTITESDVLAYLKSHPESTRAFYVQSGGGDACPNRHDVPAIWRDAAAYKVAWLDHGKPVDATVHVTLEEALSKYIRMRYLGG